MSAMYNFKDNPFEEFMDSTDIIPTALVQLEYYYIDKATKEKKKIDIKNLNQEISIEIPMKVFMI